MAKNSAKKSRAQKPSQGAMLREELIIRLSELIEITRRVQRETERQLVVSVDRICKVVEESTARSMSATEGFIDDLSDRLDKGLKSRDTENWPMSGYERKLLEQGLTQRDAELRVLRREKDETGETIKQLRVSIENLSAEIVRKTDLWQSAVAEIKSLRMGTEQADANGTPVQRSQ